MLILLLGVSVTLAACKSGGGSTDTPLNPSNPPAGLDTSQAQMTDGAGNAGPAHAQLLSVRPDPNSQVVVDTSTGSCNKNSAFNCFELDAQICMDAVANPTGNALLNSMRIGAVFSADGVGPIIKNGFPDIVSPDDPTTVASGGCATMLTPINAKPAYPAEGVPRFLMLVATYGNGSFANINGPACPSLQAMQNVNPTAPPQCAFHRAYDLGYHY